MAIPSKSVLVEYVAQNSPLILLVGTFYSKAFDEPASSTSAGTAWAIFLHGSARLVGSYSSDSASAINNRSRATSNTSSNPDQLIFQSFTTPSQRQLQVLRSTQNADSSHVLTDTVGRMLQCFSVLASVQSGDKAQERIETLTKTLKHNWLGRGRTGRDRRGFVGTKVKTATLPRQNSNETATTTSSSTTSDRATASNGLVHGTSARRNSLLSGSRNMGVSAFG